MRKIVMTTAATAVLMISCKGEKKEKIEVKKEIKVERVIAENNVDLSASLLTWKGTKPGDVHNGTVALKESSLRIENGVIAGGEFTVDMTSIENLDIKNPDYAAKLVDHLNDADFFDVEKYPTSKFVITSVTDTNGNLAVTGNLTIKDVTKSVTIPATLSEEDGVYTFESTPFNIDRADFNVTYKSKRFFDNLKDKFIDNLIEMSFKVKTIIPKKIGQ